MLFLTNLPLAGELPQSIHCKVRSPSPQADSFFSIQTNTPKNHCISFVQKVELQNAVWFSCSCLEIGNVSKFWRPTE
eukprot:Skav207883  [mRNA]  locus=scaffold664:514556:514786:+ [translate_table: standard]